MELLCPAGNLKSALSAFEAGADAVYFGFSDQTNARNFPGINFTFDEVSELTRVAHSLGKKTHLALNTFPAAGKSQIWFQNVDRAIELGVDTIITADLGLLDYVSNLNSDIELHLSVQASATNIGAIEFYTENFSIDRIVLPRVLSIKQVEMLSNATDIPLEVFAFGSLCIMAEGRCFLSSYLTGESPNNCGACSPAKFVSWEENGNQLSSKLNGFVIDQYQPNENAGYPTLCKGRFEVDGELAHYLEEPTSLNSLELLPQLMEMNVASVKIEGRQRGAAYVRQVARIWRQAIDSCLNNKWQVKSEWMLTLAKLSEGKQTTLGAYAREWQ